MPEILDVLRLIGGFVYLVLGGDLLVRGALAVSHRTSVSPVIVGLTVVAFGTSAPELFVSVYATLSGFSGMALGNVVGSNIANVLLVLGAPALIRPILAESPELKHQCLFMLAVSVVFAGIAMTGTISRPTGWFLLGALVAALLIAYRQGITLPGTETPDDEEQYERVLGLPAQMRIATLFIVLGIVMLPLGADLTVDGAVAIAKTFDIPDSVIGSTIVALGTSLPELSTTVIAAFHRSSDIALGNVVGSNVFNILLVAGASAAVAPLAVPAAMQSFDLWVMLAASVVLSIFVVRHKPVGKWVGALFVGAYVGYLVVLI